MKSSFILYADAYDSIRNLTPGQKAQILDAVFLYNLGENIPTLDPVVDMAFTFLRRTFDRENEKYAKVCERNRKNGPLGGRPKSNPNNPDEPKKPSGLVNNPNNPDGADTDPDSYPAPVPAPEKKEKIYVGGSEPLRLAEFFYSLILANNPKFTKPNMQAWAKHVDLLMRKDGRTSEEISAVMEWVQSDTVPHNGFCWAVNVLSTEKLRKQFSQLEMKMPGGSAVKVRDWI